MLKWIKDGVDTSIEGTGGADCVNFMSISSRIFETILHTLVFGSLTRWAITKTQVPRTNQHPVNTPRIQKALLFLLCLVFGIELGFKIITETLIWTLNPCHLITIIQIFLLASEPSPFVTAVFRVHVYLMNGPFLALAFPVTNTRLLPFECSVYLAQHFLILIIPIVLVDQHSVYSMEPLHDFSWFVLSLSLQMLYHFLFLQPVGMMTQINLNNIICPAVSDPFTGPHYRLMAGLHQPPLIFILGKMLTLFSLLWKAQILRLLNISSREVPAVEHGVTSAYPDKLLTDESEKMPVRGAANPTNNYSLVHRGPFFPGQME